jgi:putative membrane protein
MMRRSTQRPILLAAAFAATAWLAACEREAQEPAEPAAKVDAPVADAPDAELPGATTARGLVMRLALIDLYEIQASELALERARNPQVRAFAETLIKDHRRLSNEAMSAAAAQQVDVAAPSQPDQRRRQLLQALRDASDFDSAFVDQQLEAHANTLNLLRDYTRNGDNEAFKAWAGRAAPMIENHLQMAQALDRAGAETRPGAPGAQTP